MDFLWKFRLSGLSVLFLWITLSLVTTRARLAALTAGLIITATVEGRRDQTAAARLCERERGEGVWGENFRSALANREFHLAATEGAGVCQICCSTAPCVCPRADRSLSAFNTAGLAPSHSSGALENQRLVGPGRAGVRPASQPGTGDALRGCREGGPD